ncbi:hypothetical protein T09_2093 [Trichinella sp. T9]|nr:hypothetical protein T09_2093 [Trichinella sp. T9]
MCVNKKHYERVIDCLLDLVKVADEKREKEMRKGYGSVRSSSKEQRFTALVMAVNIVRKILEKRQFDLPMRTFLLLRSSCAVDGDDSVKMAIKTDRPARNWKAHQPLHHLYIIIHAHVCHGCKRFYHSNAGNQPVELDPNTSSEEAFPNFDKEAGLGHRAACLPLKIPKWKEGIAVEALNVT